MDAKPKSNKLKRLEKKRKLAERTERQAQESASSAAAARALRAEQALRDSKSLRSDPRRLIRVIAEGRDVQLPRASGLSVVARIVNGLKSGDPRNGYPIRPDVEALHRLVLLCLERAGLFQGHDAQRFANALLALSAHKGSWVREPEDWEPRSHNVYRQFHSLVRHLIARYDVPTFMNTAWLAGLTANSLVHQRWFIHVAQGQSIRTADGLPIPLTKKQAHLYLQSPDDFDVLGAFRWAQILDLGGTERLVRSVITTRIYVEFDHDEFWVTVLRWLIANPMLDPAQHGPIIDYLNAQRFVASVPNPAAHSPGQPRLVPPQPNLTMKGRNPVTLLRSVADWHRQLGRDRTKKVSFWETSGIESFRFEEGKGENAKVYTIGELLSSRELLEEGIAMSHCVSTYAASCASGQVSIWTLKVADATGNEARLLTLEVRNPNRQIVQARQKFNKLPSLKELMILRRWTNAGGPTLSGWMAR